MRFHTILPLTAALASAIVLPSDEQMNQIAIESNRQDDSYLAEIRETFIDALDSGKNAIDAAIEDASSAVSDAVDGIYETTDDKLFDAENWLSDFNRAHEKDFDYSVQGEVDDDALHGHMHALNSGARDWLVDLGLMPPHKKHGGPPRRGGPDKFRRPYGDAPRSPFPPGPPGPPGPGEHDHPPPPPPPPPHGVPEGPPPHHGGPDHPPPPPHGGREQPPPPPHDGSEHPPHEGPDHHRKKPHHPHHKPNLTVYELISKSNYTTKLAKLIDEFPDVVELLNGTAANFTIFAPTDKAFEKIPKHGHHHPPKEFLLKILQYHVIPDLFPASRVLKSRTLPTVLEGTGLSSDPKKNPQRLSVNLGLKGLTVNFYSRVIAINIFGSNGIVHGIDSILVPPPKAAKIIQFLPGEFSTLELGLFKTGLFAGLNDTSSHLGGTLFAPSNAAWQRLGPKATGFLFSTFGRKYLKALLEYHISPNVTLYSDALYAAPKESDSDAHAASRTFHIDLPTLLDDKYLSIDVARFARFVDIRINGFQHVAVTDGITKDGVIHVVSNVIIPPKTPGGYSDFVEEEMDVNELKARLEPFTKEADAEETEEFEHVDEEQKSLDEIPLEL